MWNEPTAPPAALPPALPLESDQAHTPAQARTCLNCATLLTDAFCAHCGQRAGDAHLSVREIFHEVAAEHFGLDTKVARTLAALVRHPGRLTVEFLAGRRVRYLPPLRLYLSLSVLYFLASAFASNIKGTATDAGGLVKFNTSGAKSKSRIVSFSFDTAASLAAPLKTDLNSAGVKSGTLDKIKTDTLHGNSLSLFFKRRLDRRLDYLKGHKSEAANQISESFQHELPDALFLLVPGLALALSVLYFGGHRYYAEHLVFALHFQAFSFAALTIGLIPIPFLEAVTGLAIGVYLFLALRRVYGQSALATAGKFVAIVIGYGISLTLVIGVVGFTAFFFA